MMTANPSCARCIWAAAGLLALAPMLPASVAAEDPPLFRSERVSDDGTFTKGVEGPAVDAEGNLYVVNFKAENTDGKGTIGRLAKDSTKFALFTRLPKDKQSIGNGIRFDREGRMYIVDYVNHNVFMIERGDNKPKVYFHSAQFHQPNDLAVAADGTLYVSDPDFPNGKTGRVWRITRNADGSGHGEIMDRDIPGEMGTTNGIDLSPDGNTLYVSESNALMVLSYRIDGSHLRDRQIVIQFGDHKEVDGLRTDVDGRIFLARPSAQQIVILKTDHSVAQTVKTLKLNPNNLTFGGADGRTVFVTQMDGGFVESFRTDRPGREPCLQTQAPGMC
jgi:signal peptidase